MRFINKKTDGGKVKGKISFYCSVPKVSLECFRKYLKSKDKVWKYAALAEEMLQIISEDECNDTYGKIRMYQALKLCHPDDPTIPIERTVYRIMKKIGLVR